MKFYEVILIGVALAMDAFALTIANCTTYKDNLSSKRAWSMPFAFGLFQFLMPILGYYVGSIFSSFLQNIAEYLTATIFFILSVKIIIDIRKDKKSNEPTKTNKFTIWNLMLQGVATSLDALLIGVTFAVKLNFSIFLASGVIGIVTFIIVVLALYIGKGLGKVLGSLSQYAGAIILFFLAVKNLISAII